MLADVERPSRWEHGALSVHRPGGSLLVVPLPGRLFRIMVTDTERLHVPGSTEVSLEEVRESARRVAGIRALRVAHCANPLRARSEHLGRDPRRHDSA